MIYSNQPRRLPEQLTYYWQRLKGQRKWPAVADIKANSMPDVWDDIFIVSAKTMSENPEKLMYHYVYQGKNIQKIFGDSTLGLQQGLEQKFDNVIFSKDSMQDEQCYTNRNGIRIKYRQIILPLGNQEDVVDHLLGGMRHTAESKDVFL